MMILAAVLLILAFIALSSQVARVQQLGGETQTEQRRPILLEAQALARGVDAVIRGLQDPDLPDPPLDLSAALIGSLAHIEAVEAARGFLFSYELPCLAGTGTVEHRLTDGEVVVEVVSAETFPC